MRSTRTIAFALALVPALAALEPLASRAGDRSGAVAFLGRFSGEVDVEREGAAITASTGLGLEDGDVLHTQAGEATLNFSDGSQIDIEPQTRLAISEESGHRDIEISFGSLWSFIASRKQRSMRFRTGRTVAAVRGTEIEYAAAPSGEVDAGVVEGTLELSVTEADGEVVTVLLARGQRSRVPAMGPPGRVQRFSPGDIARGERGRHSAPSGSAGSAGSSAGTAKSSRSKQGRRR